MIAFAYALLTVAGLLALSIWVGAMYEEAGIVLNRALTWLPLSRTALLEKLETTGVFSIGGGVGITGWLVTGQGAFRYLAERMPRAWGLWRRGILTSLVPVLKYALGGILMGTLGGSLIWYLWGAWTSAYDAGLVVGALVGAVRSARQVRQKDTSVDFLEANHRYLNDQKVTIFTETEKP
ncbi:MAG: hypothetical protein V5A20_00465 [Salinibacter sp.]|uniref:hypothetical protein n=1 Tax=Salinibacter sp. TaxID=2065818 RepID=UPI002FC2B3A0